MLNLKNIIETLSQHNVDFVIIGGMAAIAHGASYVTADVDMCYARNKENLARLVAALKPFQPRLRDFPRDLPLFFDENTLGQGLQFTLTTSQGDIDLLGEVAGVGDFQDVERCSIVLDLFGFDVKVLDLPALIRAKQAAGRPKDLLLIPELEGLLLLYNAQDSD